MPKRPRWATDLASKRCSGEVLKEVAELTHLFISRVNARLVKDS